MTEATSKQIADQIIGMERAALNRWGKGDPSGFLEISAPEVVSFDPFLERRLDGLPALKNYYEALRGKIQVQHDEMLHPAVQVCGDAAVLTFNYVSSGNAGRMNWNCTEGIALKCIAAKQKAGASSRRIGQSPST